MFQARARLRSRNRVTTDSDRIDGRVRGQGNTAIDCYCLSLAPTSASIVGDGSATHARGGGGGGCDRMEIAP